MSDLLDVVVPLYEVRGPSWKGLGTAALVGSFGDRAMILTARHIVEHLADEMESPRPTYPKLTQVFAWIGGAEGPFLAELVRLSISRFADIGFGLLMSPPGRTFGPALAIDPSPVLPGTTIYATGYSGLPLTERHDWDAQTFGVRLERRLQCRRGLVVGRHLGGMRQFKWPVFKVDTSLDSGMSGGPILEFRGNEPIVRGVICADLTLGDNPTVGSGTEAFASELWPTLMMRAGIADDFVSENGQPLRIETFLDMIREELILDRGNTLADFIWEPGTALVSVRWRGVPGTAVAPVEE